MHSPSWATVHLCGYNTECLVKLYCGFRPHPLRHCSARLRRTPEWTLLHRPAPVLTERSRCFTPNEPSLKTPNLPADFRPNRSCPCHPTSRPCPVGPTYGCRREARAITSDDRLSSQRACAMSSSNCFGSLIKPNEVGVFMPEVFMNFRHYCNEISAITICHRYR